MASGLMHLSTTESYEILTQPLIGVTKGEKKTKVFLESIKTISEIMFLEKHFAELLTTDGNLTWT